MSCFTAFKNRVDCITALRATLSNQNGSVIVIALLILVILTLGGITATQRSITENFTVRNTAIHKQNIYLAEAAALEAARIIMAEQDFEDLRPGVDHDWIRDRSTWNDNPLDADTTDPDSYPLTDANSGVPEVMENLLNIRGFADDPNDPGATYRYYFVGWQDGGAGESLDIGASVRWRLGRAVGVYNSRNFGNKTIEVGLKIER